MTNELAREVELLREVVDAFEARRLGFPYPRLDWSVEQYRREFPKEKEDA